MKREDIEEKARLLQQQREQGELSERDYNRAIAALPTLLPEPQAPPAPPPSPGLAPSSMSGADFFATGGAAPPTPLPVSPPETAALSPLTDNPDAPTLMRRYRLDKLLGEGGMGRVFLAFDLLTKQPCALKLIHPHLASDEAIHGRFVQELTLTQTLTHPNIVRSFSLLEDTERNVTFFTMEYVQGQSLEELLEEAEAEDTALALEQTLEIVKAVGDALNHAHSKGVIHRDIKPANVLLSEDGAIKIMDFGIARAISEDEEKFHTGHVGTVYYMAPEQLKGNAPVSQAADQFSLGVMLYQMLTGELPVGHAPAPSELVEDLPTALDAVVLRTLSPLPDRRFDSIRDFLEALDKAMKRTERRSLRERGGERRSRRSRRRSEGGTIRKPKQKAVTIHSFEEAINGFFNESNLKEVENKVNDIANQFFGAKTGGREENTRERRQRRGSREERGWRSREERSEQNESSRSRFRTNPRKKR